MRKTIARVVIGLTLLSVVACGDKHKQPPITKEGYEPDKKLKDEQKTAPKLPAPPQQ